MHLKMYKMVIKSINSRVFDFFFLIEKKMYFYLLATKRRRRLLVVIGRDYTDYSASIIYE